MDQQALFEKFLAALQQVPPAPDYLGEEPESAATFDPYQMVAEWIALRQEVKQQGKLMQATQSTLQQALEKLEDEKAELQQQLEASQKQETAQTAPKTLWRDLLTVMDALDQAYNHWQEQIDALNSTPSSSHQPDWQKRLRRLLHIKSDLTNTTSIASLQDVLVSNQQGVALIRRSLLDILRQHQVTPIDVLGQPFNPKIMYAIGRQSDASVPENTVIQEVVRGYFWNDQILREAQVIVSTRNG